MISVKFRWVNSILEDEWHEYISTGNREFEEFMRSRTHAHTMQYENDEYGEVVLIFTVYFISEIEKLKFMVKYL